MSNFNDEFDLTALIQFLGPKNMKAIKELRREAVAKGFKEGRHVAMRLVIPRFNFLGMRVEFGEKLMFITEEK